jgi:hypothetical protein
VRGDGEPREARRLFEQEQRRLGMTAPTRDLHAAVGGSGSGEVAGWPQYSAGNHDLIRTANLEALHLCRLAGDMRRPGESLGIVRTVLGASLPP